MAYLGLAFVLALLAPRDVPAEVAPELVGSAITAQHVSAAAAVEDDAPVADTLDPVVAAAAMDLRDPGPTGEHVVGAAIAADQDVRRQGRDAIGAVTPLDGEAVGRLAVEGLDPREGRGQLDTVSAQAFCGDGQRDVGAVAGQVGQGVVALTEVDAAGQVVLEADAVVAATRGDRCGRGQVADGAVES